ncbi:MAG TPA: folylpolyglutamate synthase/dihydrofolate synthase family protein [Gammaproteobacteria bacterium]|nr:folylpolyglutamate synthase/dihydrofolate synthase family protein [Gammaproteobacteria bacterium]
MIDAPAPGAALGAWLDYLERFDPNRIELGLERVRAVLRSLDLFEPPYRVFTIGGTNGKGSVATYLAALLHVSGHGPVGVYTSPHLSDYRERITLDGEWVDEPTLVSAFETVESARGEVPLTYFEFGTVVALEVFRRRHMREVVLEVGLGGRLDAVNAIDPDAAAVVSVDLDHQKWLGNDRDSIGREKAGIFRAGMAAVIGDRAPPRGLLDEAGSLGAKPLLIGRDFDAEPLAAGTWRYRGENVTLQPLPEPGIRGACQRDNAAVALALLETVEPAALSEPEKIGEALHGAHLGGRLECRLGSDGVEWVLDVAHNPAAARVLACWLDDAARRRTHAVLGMLSDKDAATIAGILAPHIDDWHLAGLGGVRGQSAEELAARIADEVSAPVLWDNIGKAVAGVAQTSRPGERIVIVGSFHTLAEALATGLIPEE